MPNIFTRDDSTTKTQETILNVLFVVAVVLFGILMLCMASYTCRARRLRQARIAQCGNEGVMLMQMDPSLPSGKYSILGYIVAENKDGKVQIKEPSSKADLESAAMERVADIQGNVCVVEPKVHGSDVNMTFDISRRTS